MHLLGQIILSEAIANATSTFQHRFVLHTGKGLKTGVAKWVNFTCLLPWKLLVSITAYVDEQLQNNGSRLVVFLSGIFKTHTHSLAEESHGQNFSKKNLLTTYSKRGMFTSQGNTTFWSCFFKNFWKLMQILQRYILLKISLTYSLVLKFPWSVPARFENIL